MITTVRRCTLALIFAALWVGPQLFPVHDVGPLERVEPFWYVQFMLVLVWPAVVVWSLLEELSGVERARSLAAALPWLLAIVASAAVFGLNWVLSPAVHALWRMDPAMPALSPAVAVHHLVVLEGAISVAVTSLMVLVVQGFRESVEVRRLPLSVPVAAVALLLFLTPPFVATKNFGQLLLFGLASCIFWIRQLPVIAEKWPGRKWAVRLIAIGSGGAAWLTNIEPRGPVTPAAMFFLSLLSALELAAMALAFVVVCMSAADGIAWMMQRSRSVRTRMLVLGLFCAGLAFILTAVKVPVTMMGSFPPIASPVLSLVAKLICLAVIVPLFSSSVSKGLSKALEQSARALAEVHHGNLDVALDESGRDEVAQLARGFNRMLTQLREAEFLEKINADLASRSTQLTKTLDALRSAQADLVRSERMASVATLVKGIAHELNNPINYIAGNMTPLRRYGEFLTHVATQLSDGRARSADELNALTRLSERKDLAFVSEDLARLTADIAEGARRAQLIIADLQSLTSAAQRGVERVDLHRVARQTIALLRPQAPPNVHLETNLTPASMLTARAGQLEQVFVNLTDNAIRAVGGKGNVRLYVGEADDQIVVRITDDGSGMSPEVKSQAFEPFFTTRPAGEGSGLGLAIVASIVRAHNGTVTITSEPGRGTEVEVRLPSEGGDLEAAFKPGRSRTPETASDSPAG